MGHENFLIQFLGPSDDGEAAGCLKITCGSLRDGAKSRFSEFFREKASFLIQRRGSLFSDFTRKHISIFVDYLLREGFSGAENL